MRPKLPTLEEITKAYDGPLPERMTGQLVHAYLYLLEHGVTRAQAAIATGISEGSWRHLATKDSTFCASRAQMMDAGGVQWATLLCESMKKQVEAGSPWAVKWVMANFATGFVDPDAKLLADADVTIVSIGRRMTDEERREFGERENLWLESLPNRIAPKRIAATVRKPRGSKRSNGSNGKRRNGDKGNEKKP